MTQHAMRAADQLAAMLNAPHLPERVRKVGRGVQQRLGTPVRLAIMGRPDDGTAEVVDGLLQGTVLDWRAGLPPVEIAFGPTPEIQVTDGEGASGTITAEAFAATDPLDLAMVRIAAPLPLLERVTLLWVPVEAAGEEARRALSWVGRRADMLLWCATEFGPSDQELLASLPEPLCDHAHLVFGDPSGTTLDAAALHETFHRVHHLRDGPERDQDLAALRAHILAHVSDARRADLEGALRFLDQYGAHHGIAPPVPPVMPLSSPPTDRSAPSRLLDAPDLHVAPSAASGIIGRLSGAAAPISAALDQRDGHPDVAALLGHCVDTLSACAGIVEGDPLEELLGEAQDLALLMQIEESHGALTDTLALMVQVRRACEAALPA